MGYLLKRLDEQGNFELLDAALLSLYPDVKVEDLIPLSDEQYLDFCARDNGRGKFIDGNFVFEQAQFDEATLLEQKRTDLIQKLAEKADHLKNQILVGYPQTEIDSFYRQEREAREWLADNQYDPPMLAAIADTRGIPLARLAQKVIEKADKLAAIMGEIIGTRQALESRILKAKNLEELTPCKQEIEQWQQPNH